MAEHGTVEYATAAGNDYPAHERGYESFIHFTFTGILFVINVVFGLTVGGVMGHWVLEGLIMVIAALGGLFSLGGSKKPSYVAFVLCFLIFVYSGVSH